MLSNNFGLNSISEIAHYFAYLFKKRKGRLEKAMLIISTDIDVGASKLGIFNKGVRDRDVNLNMSEYRVGQIEEISIPIFVDTFDAFDIPVTFGVRGQMLEVENTVMDFLLASKTKHDIGAHGYYHKMFTELTHSEAEDEIRQLITGMKEYGLTPRSFIFPGNRVAHLDLLEKYKFTCYRSRGNLFNDTMYIEKCGGLYNVHPSIYIDGTCGPVFLKMILDISIKEKLPFHVWFHFWNFGTNRNAIEKTVQGLIVPFLQHAAIKHDHGLLTFETMLSAAQKAKKSF